MPDGSAPTPFSHLPSILAKSACGIESVDPCGVGHVTSPGSAGGCFKRSSSRILGLGPLPGNRSPGLRPLRFPYAFPPRDLPAPAMVTAGAPEPLPERVAAWSAIVAKPPSVPEIGTMATKPLVPPAPRPSTTVSERLLLPEHAVPSAAGGSGPTAQVLAQAVPSAAPAPAPGLPVPPSVAVPGAPTPVPGVPVVPPAVVPGAPAQASASSLQAVSATTGGLAPLLAPSAQQAHWPAHPGGQGDWRGPRGRGGGYRPPMTMADLQREVSRAVREERAAQSQSSSMRALPAPETHRQHVLPSSPPPVVALEPHSPFPEAPAPAASALAPGSRLHLPPVPLVAGVEFVAEGGGSAAGLYPPSAVVDEPFQFLAEAPSPVRPCFRGNPRAAMAVVRESSCDPVGASAGSCVSSLSSRRVFAGWPA
ncbi:unnamed protein product [Closterium sp. NIES-54]